MSRHSRPLFAPTKTTFAVGLALSALWNAAVSSAQEAQTQCLSNKALNDVFAVDGPIPKPGSCCMQDVCGLACPVPTPEASKGYGIAVAVSIVISFLVGISALIMVRGKSVNFFVAGRSLPLWIVAVTLTAASVDSNCLLGNVDLSYRYSFYDGAVLPIGLAISLFLNGIFLAHHINKDEALTLPDVFAKRYGRIVEVLASLCTVCSFLMLLAGNLVGFGVITSFVWNIKESHAIWTSAAVVWGYTTCGGLFSVAFADVVQGFLGFTGCVVAAFWFLHNEENQASPPSIGFPNYTYPDTFGDGGPCDMYNGTKCYYSDGCCYNTEQWCPNYSTTGVCDRYDRAAYPLGDKRVYSNEMTSALALDPFPNAIFWNWATLFILGVGNLGALDFQARCMASKTPTTARIGCFIAGAFTLLLGIPFSYLGALTRVYYGPDAVTGEFSTDTCQTNVGIPTCALWVPNPDAFIKLLAFQAPPVIGAWCMVGIIAASMSTSSGAILAMGTVMAHNVARQADTWYPEFVTPDNLLRVARVTTIPFCLASTMIAAYYRTTNPQGGTGYLLIVAFDIVLATVVVPLFGCFYCKKPSPRAALVATVAGGSCRVIMEFTLPKDHYLILPFNYPAFYNVGVAPSANYPTFMDVPADMIWNSTAQPCVQKQFRDFTGVDSISSFLVCLILFTSIQFAEHKLGRPLFTFSGSQGYVKDTTEHPLKGLNPGDIGKILEEANATHRAETLNDDSVDRDTSVKFKEGGADIIGERGEQENKPESTSDSSSPPVVDEEEEGKEEEP